MPEFSMRVPDDEAAPDDDSERSDGMRFLRARGQ
jgi:hypothetical protein